MKSNKNICREIRNQKSEVRSQKSFLSLKVVGLVIISILVGCNNPFVPPKPPIPDAPILLRPDDKASFLPDREVTFSWMPTLENILDTKGYQLQISNNKSFSTCVINLTTASRTYKHSFTNMGEYYWRVKLQVKTFNQWSNWSLVRSFKIGLESNSPPVTPHTPSPADNATGVSPILTLGWWSGDINQDIVTYFIYFAADTPFIDTIATITDSSMLCPTQLSFELTQTLDTFKMYYWKITAKDNWGATSYGPIWKFTTGKPNNPPNKPDKPTGPNPGYIDEICTFTTKTTDADGDNVCYKFDFGDGTPFSNWTSFVTSGNPGSASHTYRKLGTFYVKAQAKDEPGAVSEWSDAMAITIKVGPGAIWVADCSGGQPPNDSGEVVKLGKGGSRICSYGFHRPTLDSSAHPHFQGPWRLAVDPQDGDVWIACSFGIDRVFKLSVNGKYKGMLIPETTCPSTPCVDNNGDCWIPLVDGKKIIKLARLPVGLDIIKIGEILDNLGNMIYPIAIALDIDSNWIWVVESSMAGGYVSKFDGSPPHSRLLGPLGGFKATWAEVDPVTHYCWVADGGSNLVKKISPAGQITPYSGSGFSEPACLSVNPNTHEIWVADKNNNRVVKLSEIGEERCVVGGLSFPMAVEVDPNDGSCWIADPGSMKVIKVDAVGGFLFEVTGFTEPAGLSLNPNADL